MKFKKCQNKKIIRTFSCNSNTKAQMEIMGLLVIIILLAIGMLFTVNYMINKNPSDAKKKFTESQMASNILSSMLKTSTPQDVNDQLYCHKVDFTELLQDCATFETIRCYNGMGSCEYASEYMSEMLNNTLVQWNRPFRFKAWRVDGEGILYMENLACNDQNIGPGKDYIGRETKLSPIPLNPGTLMVQFDICS